VSNQVEIIYSSTRNSKETGEIIRISPRKSARGIRPYCAIRHYEYTMKRTASDLSIICTVSDLSTNTMSLDFQFKGHKSLEYWCLVIHLTSVSTISYAESNVLNGGIFTLLRH
jgi:hypothetical protein